MPKSQVWSVYNCDAGKWDKYDDYNIFYIYNSFPLEVVREVNEKICESLQRLPRSCKILYLMPEFPSVFVEDSRWQLVERGSEIEIRYGMWIFKNVEKQLENVKIKE